MHLMRISLVLVMHVVTSTDLADLHGWHEHTSSVAARRRSTDCNCPAYLRYAGCRHAQQPQSQQRITLGRGTRALTLKRGTRALAPLQVTPCLKRIGRCHDLHALYLGCLFTQPWLSLTGRTEMRLVLPHAWNRHNYACCQPQECCEAVLCCFCLCPCLRPSLPRRQVLIRYDSNAA